VVTSLLGGVYRDKKLQCTASGLGVYIQLADICRTVTLSCARKSFEVCGMKQPPIPASTKDGRSSREGERDSLLHHVAVNVRGETKRKRVKSKSNYGEEDDNEPNFCFKMICCCVPCVTQMLPCICFCAIVVIILVTLSVIFSNVLGIFVALWGYITYPFQYISTVMDDLKTGIAFLKEGVTYLKTGVDNIESGVNAIKGVGGSALGSIGLR
jgi:hypothetical protein